MTASPRAPARGEEDAEEPFPAVRAVRAFTHDDLFEVRAARRRRREEENEQGAGGTDAHPFFALSSRRLQPFASLPPLRQLALAPCSPPTKA